MLVVEAKVALVNVIAVFNSLYIGSPLVSTALAGPTELETTANDKRATAAFLLQSFVNFIDNPICPQFGDPHLLITLAQGYIRAPSGFSLIF